MAFKSFCALLFDSFPVNYVFPFFIDKSIPHFFIYL